MANTNRPFGLRPVRHLDGSSWNGRTSYYYCPASYGTALYPGDPVTLTGTGNAAAFMDFPIGTLSTCQIAIGGDVADVTKLVLGCVVGVLPLTNASLVYKPASTEAIILVCDSPDVIFEIQDDGGGTPAVTWVGSNANLISGAGSGNISGWALDGGTSDGPDTDASNQLIIKGFANRANNEIGDYAVWEVLINQHSYLQRNALGTAV